MPSTKELILQIAEKFTKQQGLNGFSYRDIAQLVGIKTAAIHYHFPTKDALIVALIERYTLQLEDFLQQTSAATGYARLAAVFTYIKHIASGENDFCLCGMLAAEIHALSLAAKSKLKSFFSLFEHWVQSTLADGIADGSCAKFIDPKQEALLILALVEGSMLVNRVRPKALDEVFDLMLQKLRP